jgi:hypothetical protein
LSANLENTALYVFNVSNALKKESNKLASWADLQTYLASRSLSEIQVDLKRVEKEGHKIRKSLHEAIKKNYFV